MSIVIPELVLESIFRESFKEIREDPSRLDNWLETYTFAYLEQSYGQGAIERIKKFINENEIPILHAWHDVESKVPCVTISTLNMDEQQEDALLGDYGFTEDIDTSPEVVLSNVVVNSFDINTGWATLDSSTVLTSVSPGQVFVSSNGTSYSILTLIDNGTDKRIGLGIDNTYSDFWDGRVTPDTGNIVSNITFFRNRNLVVPVYHQILIGVHTEDAFMTKNLHYILTYILLYAKQKLTNRNLLLSTWSASDFGRDLGYLPEHIYTRSLEVHIKTFFQWNESRDRLASDVGGKIRVPKDIYDREDGDIFTVDTEEDQ